MQAEKQTPQHKYYILLDKQTMKPLWIPLNKKSYMFLAKRQYFLNQEKEFFSLKEKLFILNLSYDVVWWYIPGIAYFFMIVFFNAINPSCLKLNINKGKATPYIQKGGF